MSDNAYYENRYSFWNRNKTNLSKIDNAYQSFQSFEDDYFSDEKGVSAFFNLVRDKYSYDKDESTLYKTFACDLSWAKNTTFCGGSGGGNTTPSWDNYPCVVELAKSKGISINRGNSYSIGDIKYYPNGRKANTKTKGKPSNFTCNDAEFKTSNTGGSSNTGGGEYQSKEDGAYTTPGDPYQYKVVNGQWHTKSWKNRGKIIQNWTSLANNQTATSRLDKRHPGVRVGKQGNEKSAEYAKKFGQELERSKSLMDKKIEYTPSDYRKYLTNPATNTTDSTATSAKPTVDIKPAEPEISGPVRTINPADPF
jgi:hypothetical protein